MSIDLTKIHKVLHASTIEEMNAMSPERLHTKMVEAHLEKQRAKAHLKEDEDICQTRQNLKNLEAEPKETIKRADATEDYAAHLLEEKGVA